MRRVVSCSFGAAKMIYCQTCKKELNCHTGPAEGLMPKAGDYTMCVYCGSIYIFDNPPNFRNLTTQELGDLMKSEAWGTIQEARQLAKEYMTKEDV